MVAFFVLIAVGMAIIVYILGKPAMRESHRRRLRLQPLPPDWQRFLDRQWPFYGRLPEALRPQLHGIIQILLDEKQFVGCAGLAVTKEMELMVAAQAALLLLNRETNYFERLSSILIYPSAFFVDKETRDETGVHSRHQQVLSGESWDQGKVVLSWDDVVRGAADVTDGRNVVLHEFAHQLDQESGVANGAPLLDATDSYAAWSRALSGAYERLRQKSELGEDTVMDYYGALNPAEFFAVATETFFENPVSMNREYPDLYVQLQHYYKVDPEQWH